MGLRGCRTRLDNAANLLQISGKAKSWAAENPTALTDRKWQGELGTQFAKSHLLDRDPYIRVF
jgi:hypothetical protein